MSVTVEIKGKQVTFDLSVHSGEVQLNVIGVDGKEVFSEVLWIDRDGKLNRFSYIEGNCLPLNDRGEIKKGSAF